MSQKCWEVLEGLNGLEVLQTSAPRPPQRPQQAQNHSKRRRHDKCCVTSIKFTATQVTPWHWQLPMCHTLRGSTGHTAASLCVFEARSVRLGASMI